MPTKRTTRKTSPAQKANQTTEPPAHTPTTAYTLRMRTAEQEIVLTSGEFASLEQHLSALRGDLADVAIRRWWGMDNAPDASPEMEKLLDSDHAETVHAARAIYAYCPELIVTPDEAFAAAVHQHSKKSGK